MTEFLNRIDDIIMFSPLTKKRNRIHCKFMNSKIYPQTSTARNQNLCLRRAITALAKWGFEPEYGGRPVKRVIQKKLLNALSKELLAGKIDNTNPILVDHFDGKIVFRNLGGKKE